MNNIRMSTATANIAQALHMIQSELKPIEKKGKNTQQNYAYAKFEDYIEGIKDILNAQGLTIVTTVNEPKRLEPRTTKHGSIQYAVEVAITARLFHKTGEWIEIDCYGEGQDSGDKAIYKAITGARKYALACLLGLATKDDPENDEEETRREQRSQQRSAPPQRQQSAPPRQQTPPAKAATPPAKSPTATPEQIDELLSVAVDEVRQAPNLVELKKAINKNWLPLKKLTGEKHPKLEALRKHFNERKAALEALEPPPTRKGTPPPTK